MSDFLFQLQYNIKNIINNISKKYNLPKKDLIKEFYPKVLSEQMILKLNEVNKNIHEKKDSKLIYVQDRKGNKYVIVDSKSDVIFNQVYTAIKFSS